MHRRSFLKLCTSVAAASLAFSPSFLKAKNISFKPYKKALLLEKDGSPLKAESVDPSKEYIFFYPYRATPCILLNLGNKLDPVEVKLSDGSTYNWIGGVGPKGSIVAYSAICPHQLSYPTPETSFINFYPKGEVSKIIKRDRVIQCCAHLSVFDPSHGGKVVEGPSPFPLTTIVLKYENSKIYAIGTLGKELFEEFFDAFKPDLRKLYKSSKRAKKLMDICKVVELEEYTKEIIKC